MRERRTQASEITTSFSAKPYPFNKSTTISFSAPKTQDATLKIFSAAGQLTYEKMMTADKGTNELIVSANELRGTGVYWLRLQSGDKVVSKKLILVE